MINQLLINIIVSGATYLIIALSFSLIFSINKFINIFHAIIITSGAYFCFTFSELLSIPITLSITMSIISCVIINFAFGYFFSQIQSYLKISSIKMLIITLGLYIVFQNLISIIWGDGLIFIPIGGGNHIYKLFGGSITNIQIMTLTISLIIYITFTIFMKNSIIGKRIRAISSNSELSSIFGIKYVRIVFYANGIAALLASLVGILIAADTGMMPTMGFNIFLYGVVVAIIGGIGSNKGLIGGAFLLAAIQHISAYFVSSQWMDSISYIVLIIFLIWKPLGFSGKQIKKVEI